MTTASLLLSAGRGPQECAWAVAQLLRRLEADAADQRLSTHRTRTVVGDRPGTYRSALVRVDGSGAEKFVACRTGGPGGQHRNKASTAVQATHRPSGLVVVVDTERRSQLNRRIALRLLRERLEHDDLLASQAMETDRWRLHDALERGNPVRIECPRRN